MCGRFTLTADPAELKQALDLGTVPAELEPRYNVAPTQPVAVVTDPESRDVKLFRWGLVPSWADDPSIGSRLINARSETAAEKPAFRTAFARRRCLVLADGFFEWERVEGKKGKRSQPYYFQLEAGKPFAFAGLWEIWRASEEAEPLLTCTLLTGPANERVARVHDRSPIILDGEKPWVWLDPDASRERLRDLLQPLPPERITMVPVSMRVNSPQNDAPDLIEPIEL